METLEDRFNRGMEMRKLMAGGNPSHYSLPGIDQLAPDLKRIVDEALWGSVWTRPGLDTERRCMVTVAALTALGQEALLRRNIERSLNLGLTPDQLVEVVIQMLFLVGIPSVESAMKLTKDIFEEQGIEYSPTYAYDSSRTVEELHQNGLRIYDEQMGEPPLYPVDDPNSLEMEAQKFIEQYHWGAIHGRPGLDPKSRALCSLVRHDRARTVRPPDSPPHRGRPPRRRDSPGDHGGLLPAHLLRQLHQLENRHARGPLRLRREGPGRRLTQPGSSCSSG